MWWDLPSLVPSPHTPPSMKWSGEQSQISRAYFPKVVKTNEIVRSVIISGMYSISLTTLSLLKHLYLSFEWIWHKIFWTMLCDTVTKVCTSPSNSTWFTRLLLLVREWGIGTGLKSPRTSPSVFAYWYQSNTGGNKGLGMRLSTVHCVGIMQSSICTCPPTYIDWLLMYLLDSMWYAAFSNHVPTWILLVSFLCCVHNQQLHKTQITIVNNKWGGALHDRVQSLSVIV